MQPEDDLLGYQLGHLLAGSRAGTTGVGTVGFAYLVAHFSTMGADLRACLEDRSVHGRVAYQEMGVRLSSSIPA